MKIIVIGCGGRENILVQKLLFNNDVYCVGNWLNYDITKNIPDSHYFLTELLEDSVFNICNEIKPDIIVVGPETLLNTGFVDNCNKVGIKCIAPGKKLAQLETSKYFTRNFLRENKLHEFNPKYSYITKSSCLDNVIYNYQKFVIKLDGLAGGKGVYVQDDHFNSINEGIDIISENMKEEGILIEEKLEGEEFSLFTLSDGTHFFHLPPVKDYKRAYENDKGPNTGGMGSIMEEFNFLDQDNITKCERLNSLVLDRLKEKYDEPYIGVLYGSYMKTKNNEIKLIEFNCRFGDSEVFNLLNIIETDLSLIFKSMIDGTLDNIDIKLKKNINIVKYLVPSGYPKDSIKTKIDYQNKKNVYAASLDNNGMLLGSRAIAVYAEGDTREEAYENCENLIGEITNKNLYWRKDIGLKNDAYKLAGVDIDKGNDFVKIIKNDVESTYNSNVLGKHGNFGGQFNFKNNTLVASTDGVGTKGILIKKYTKSYYICGHDIVNHSVNDILVQGATPLFFLDYIASSKLNIEDSSSFVKGCCDACKKVNCVLLGGETAEMPDVYNEGHMDMVGTIIGEKKISLCGVRKNDLAIGLVSYGPQTNGYTLIRKILESNIPPNNVLQQLLEPHGSFLEQILEIDKYYNISGMCHITGGGLTENLKRTVPKDLCLDLENLEYPEWCLWLKKYGNLSDSEMKKTFNCGIGFVVFINSSKLHIQKRGYNKLRIGILGSTRGTDIDMLIDCVNNTDSILFNRVEFVCVLSNKKNSGILDKCNKYGLFTQYVPCLKDESREEYDNKLTEIFESKEVNMILCIGWMRILSLKFIKEWKKCCYNVHPSLLPDFAGGMDMDVHKEVLSSSVKETGCTVHEVTEEVDSGPIIVQKKCPIYETDNVEILKNRVQKLEGEALIETIDMFACNKIGPIYDINNKFGKNLGIVKSK